MSIEKGMKVLRRGAVIVTPRHALFIELKKSMEKVKRR